MILTSKDIKDLAAVLRRHKIDKTTAMRIVGGELQFYTKTHASHVWSFEAWPMAPANANTLPFLVNKMQRATRSRGADAPRKLEDAVTAACFGRRDVPTFPTPEPWNRPRSEMDYTAVDAGDLCAALRYLSHSYADQLAIIPAALGPSSANASWYVDQIHIESDGSLRAVTPHIIREVALDDLHDARVEGAIPHHAAGAVCRVIAGQKSVELFAEMADGDCLVDIETESRGVRIWSSGAVPLSHGEIQSPGQAAITTIDPQRLYHMASAAVPSGGMLSTAAVAISACQTSVRVDCPSAKVASTYGNGYADAEFGVNNQVRVKSCYIVEAARRAAKIGGMARVLVSERNRRAPLTVICSRERMVCSERILPVVS